MSEQEIESMIQECKTYLCDGIPSDSDIEDALNIAKHDNCKVKLVWQVPYSGIYYVIVEQESTLKSVKAQVPRMYGV